MDKNSCILFGISIGILFLERYRTLQRRNSIPLIQFRLKMLSKWDDNKVQELYIALSNLNHIQEVSIIQEHCGFLVKARIGFNDKLLLPLFETLGIRMRFVSRFDKPVTLKKNKNEKLRHECYRKVIPQDILDKSFKGVLEYYHEQPLPEYSRYKNWTQSCYMECDPAWLPQTDVCPELFQCMEAVLDITKRTFAKWYCEHFGLESVNVITLNSFITKYIPVEGKSEFGKHVDSAHIDGTAICALPTDIPHDWPGLIIWDGPKDSNGERPEHVYKLEPGDVCCMDKLVWHHGLPISEGVRYVAVLFYACKWNAAQT